jgi:hypothetical protein
MADMTPNQLDWYGGNTWYVIEKDWLENNGISIKNETVDGNRCWHLQL